MEAPNSFSIDESPEKTIFWQITFYLHTLLYYVPQFMFIRYLFKSHYGFDVSHFNNYYYNSNVKISTPLPQSPLLISPHLGFIMRFEPFEYKL